MKKIIVFTAILLLTTGSLKAQELFITPFAGYTFADGFNFNRGRAKIGDGFTYGGIISYVVDNRMSLELTYSREDCHAMAYSSYWGIDVYEPISANYILVGGSRLLPFSEKFSAFIGPNIGVGIYSGKSGDVGTKTKFAFALNGGCRYMFTDRVGFRIQANLNMPITDVGGSLWWDSTSGTSVGISSRVPFVQFGFTGGLTFNIN
ncbi:hypothetical protein [Mangrovibacterium diazotrophicum]|uniref:Outer membrane protein with beta-barrel domain n=1 Tax=Mangrovibacterium diazotrophicum TaxID=1261403 RepID=A0A419W4E4_9BACT|nr:hypothetical protein [Mangrovibacterium diazotrophicum]RKD90317.1 hypothetical protein BC643_0654 [Mangrovibacterium diazotrophicum]